MVVGRRLATLRAWALEGYFSERVDEGGGRRVTSGSVMVVGDLRCIVRSEIGQEGEGD